MFGVLVVAVLVLLCRASRAEYAENVISGMSEETYQYMKGLEYGSDYELAKAYIKDPEKWDEEAGKEGWR